MQRPVLLPILLLLGCNSSKAKTPAKWLDLDAQICTVCVLVCASFSQRCIQCCPLRATSSLLVWPSWLATYLQQSFCLPNYLAKACGACKHCSSRTLCSRQLPQGMQCAVQAACLSGSWSASKGYPVPELLVKTYVLCWRHPEAWADKLITLTSRVVRRVVRRQLQ